MPTALAAKPAPKVATREQRLRFTRLTPFLEASVDQATRTAKVIIITEGLGNLRDRNYYTAQAIETAAKVFDGKQFYIDHPSEDEEQTRPERSVRDLGGWFSHPLMGSTKDPDTGEVLASLFATLHFDESDAGNLAMAKVRAAIEYTKQFPQSKDVYAGISINGGGVSHPGTLKGMQVNMVTEIQEAFSADIVTKPARGGRFLALQEARKLRAWKRRRAQESTTTTPRTGAEGGPAMAVAQATLVTTGKEAKRSRRTRAVDLLLEVKALRRQVKERQAAKKFGPKFKEMATEKLKAAGMKLAKMRTAEQDASGDLRDLLLDMQQDLAQLGKMLGAGDSDAGAGGDLAAEDEQGALPAGDMGGGTLTGEDEDDTEAEGEEESEDEEEAVHKAAESEGEEEAEGKATEGEGEEEAEGKATEGEGEEEALFGDEPEDDDDDGMAGDDEAEVGDDAGAPGGRAMEFKCAKCGEVNQVAPPKGYQLARAAEARRGDNGLTQIIARQKRALEAKEGRFVQTNRKVASVMKENQKLRAELVAHRRVREATKLLKEANIPADILPVKDLVMLYEPQQWPAAIAQASRMLTRESKMLGRNPGRVREGFQEKDGKDEKEQPDLFGRFSESYKRLAGG